MVRVDGVSGEAARRRRRRRASVLLGPRPVRRRVHGSFAEEVRQPIRLCCSQRDTLALRQRGGKATGAEGLRGGIDFAQPAAARRRTTAPVRVVGSARQRRILSSAPQIQIGSFWQRAAPDDDAPLLLVTTGPAPPLEQRRPPQSPGGPRPHRPPPKQGLRRHERTGVERGFVWQYKGLRAPGGWCGGGCEIDRATDP